jgi:hypothetical protein
MFLSPLPPLRKRRGVLAGACALVRPVLGAIFAGMAGLVLVGVPLLVFVDEAVWVLDAVCERLAVAEEVGTLDLRVGVGLGDFDLVAVPEGDFEGVAGFDGEWDGVGVPDGDLDGVADGLGVRVPVGAAALGDRVAVLLRV